MVVIQEIMTPRQVSGRFIFRPLGLEASLCVHIPHTLPTQSDFADEYVYNNQSVREPDRIPNQRWYVC